MTIIFTIAGAARTKKTSNRIFRIRTKDGRSFSKILPSAAHAEWFAAASKQLAAIRQKLDANHPGLFPLACSVRVEAVFYRRQRSGDLVGFEQALGDLLQWRVRDKVTKTMHYRGVIEDDVQIVSWDGSRLDKDSQRPRIEVIIETLEPSQGRLGVCTG